MHYLSDNNHNKISIMDWDSSVSNDMFDSRREECVQKVYRSDYTVGTRLYFYGDKSHKRESDRSHPASAKLKNKWILSSRPNTPSLHGCWVRGKCE
jgi:hypothetical protein